MQTENSVEDSHGDFEETESWYDLARRNFAEATTLEKAMEAVWGEDGKQNSKHGFYQHYTTLSSVVVKLAERRWWLTRSDSESLNDVQESLKFGNRDLSAKTYQASFVHGAAESAALWGLYTRGNPFAVRITISGEAIKKWVKDISSQVLSNDENGRHKIDSAEFKDIIYAAVAFRDRKRTRLDIKRQNGLYWAEVNSHSDIPGLEDAVHCEECTGWIKDYEWRHERESRLCVRARRANGSDAMYVRVTDDLANDMKFTFSPWLPLEYEEEVEKIITNALKMGSGKGSDKSNPRRFRRSVLQGALNLKSIGKVGKLTK